jgi:hypothetical protein
MNSRNEWYVSQRGSCAGRPQHFGILFSTLTVHARRTPFNLASGSGVSKAKTMIRPLKRTGGAKPFGRSPKTRQMEPQFEFSQLRRGCNFAQHQAQNAI